MVTISGSHRRPSTISISLVEDGKYFSESQSESRIVASLPVFPQASCDMIDGQLCEQLVAQMAKGLCDARRPGSTALPKYSSSAQLA